MEPAAGAGNENSEEQPGAAFRDLHQQPAGAAELADERQGEAGGRARQHPVPGRGLQEEVSLELMLLLTWAGAAFLLSTSLNQLGNPGESGILEFPAMTFSQGEIFSVTE